MKPLRSNSRERGFTSWRPRSAAWALVLAVGCSGSIGASSGERPGSTDPGDSTSGSGGGRPKPGNPGTGGGPGTTPLPDPTCGAASIPAARTWRLTNTQFRNTAMAVFGFAGPTTSELPQDAQPDGFSNQADRLSVPPLLASKYVQATDEIAANVLSRSGDFVKCPLASLGTGTCLRDFLTTVGMRAWRRPLTAGELTKYTSLFGTIAQSNAPEVAFKGVVQALMLSPNFIFRTELGAGGSGGTTALTDYELASALSYMLTDGPPDAALMDLATGGSLHEPATLAAQAKRLLGTGAEASKTMGSFFRQWLLFDDLSANKDPTLFPMYTPELVTDLVGENQALIENVLFGAGDHSVKTLMTASYAYVNSRTAPLYGVQASGSALVKTELPATQRRGVLTEAAFIAAASDSDDTNLPARGRIVREQALCEVVSPPAGNFQLDDPKITADMTNREKFITHTTNPSCAVCHSMFDGIGFALEQYDAIGRFRTMDKKKTIDATGSLPLGNSTLEFTSYVDFIDQITKRPETYQCVASQYAAFATGRAAAGLSQCESDMIAQAFMGNGYRLDALVSAIVTSPNFALRRN
jgi:hypothetical protein